MQTEKRTFAEMKREEYKSNTPWGKVIGYNRAIKIDNVVEVAGTTAINEKGKTIGSDYYEQTAFILSKIEMSLNHFGFNKEDIVRTRIYVLDINKWEEAAKAHLEFFGKCKPVNTLIEVSGFIQDDFLIEIEAKAIKTK